MVVQHFDKECIHRCSAEMGKKNEEQWWVERGGVSEFQADRHTIMQMLWSQLFLHRD